MTITEILQELGIPYLDSGHEHCRQGWVQIDCPRCGLTNHWRYGIKVSHRYGHCWTCGGIRLGDALAEASGNHIGVVLKLLGGIEESRIPTTKRLHGKLVIPQNLGPLLPAHRKYLSSRGFDPDELENVWGLKGIGLSPRLKWRIWIPFVSRHKIVSWTTRGITDSGTRYITAKPEEEAENHRELLYGEDHARHSVVVVEGPADVWRIGPGAVATFGTGYSREQVLRLSRFPVRAIAFDSEPVAQRRANRLARDLSAFPGVTTILTLKAKDPGSASEREVTEIRKRFLE